MTDCAVNRGRYYDMLNPLEPDYRMFVEGFCTPQTRVLEFGSGTGRFSIPLSAKCLSLIGVEADPKMIARAKEKCALGPQNVEFIMGDFCSAVTNYMADLIFISRDTLALEPSMARRLMAFRQIKRRMAKDGRCLIILANIARYLAEGRTRRYEKSGSGAVGVELHLKCVRKFYAENMRWIGSDIWTIRKLRSTAVFTETVEHGAITLSEIRLMSDAVGLRINQLFGDYSRSAYSAASPYLIAQLSHAAETT